MKSKMASILMATACLANSAFAAKVLKAQHSAPTAPAAPAEPYDFRGAKLGMTLDEFKKLPFPDRDDSKRAMNSTPQLRCSDELSGDYLADVHVVEEYKNAGEVECLYKMPPDKAAYRFSWEDAYLSVGEGASDGVVYLFYTDDAGAKRLGDVGITMNNATFDSLAAGLTTKLGSPTKTEEKDLQNGIGNHFKSVTLLWDNGISTVKLEQRSAKINEMQLTYTNSALSSDFYKKLVAAKGPPKL